MQSKENWMGWGNAQAKTKITMPRVALSAGLLNQM